MTDYEKICDFENLYQAHLKARKSKRYKKDVMEFEMNLMNNLWHIKGALESDSYDIAGYNKFTIYEPKRREIQALTYYDRIVQHSLCDNLLIPFIDKRLIHDNCACREGKGTHYGIKRLTQFMRNHYSKHEAEGYILKADIRKYFSNIDHRVLLDKLRKIIPDSRVMELIEAIIRSYNNDTGKGLPIGNLTSQLFALLYLDPLDRLLKENLKVKHYIRYMDDSVAIHHDKEYLRECLRQMKNLIEDDLKLEFNEKTQIFPISNGVDFLGWHFYLTDTGKIVRKLRTQNKKKMKKRMKRLQYEHKNGITDIQKISASIVATNGHLKHGHTYKLRSKIYKETIFRKDGE